MRISWDILDYQDIKECQGYWGYLGILGDIRGYKRCQGISEDIRGDRDISDIRGYQLIQGYQDVRGYLGILG